jgi:hypothetical protein
MPREKALLLVALGVVAAMAVAGVAAPDVIADREPPEEPTRLSVAELSLAPGEVTGETAGFEIDARLAHRGGPAENVTVRVRAIDADSGLVATTETVDVGTVDADGEVPVETAVRVPREGDYRIETLVFGPGDYSASIGIDHPSARRGEKDYSHDIWHYPRFRIANAAARNGLNAIDGAYSDFADMEGFREDCRRAKAHAFTGKLAIHIDQVERYLAERIEG